MSNSSLVSYAHLDADNYGPRNHIIDTITPHCFVGQVTGKRGADALTEKSSASANYVVGHDGSISLNVEEGKASMCSSSKSNDQRAVTIEVACETQHPYKITDAAYKALIDLMADICKRNNIPKLLWKADKNLIGQVDKQNITVHRWFANKACPGDYIFNHLGEICAEVNKRLEEEDMTEKEVRAIVAEMLRGEGTVVPGWAKDEMAEAIELGVTDGSRPLGYATRNEVALMVKRAVKGEKPLKYIAGALIEKVKALLNKEDKS